MALIPSYKSAMGTALIAGTDLSAALTGRTKWHRFEKASFKTSKNFKKDPTPVYHGPDKAHAGRIGVEVNAEGPLYSEGLEHVFYSALGKLTMSGAGDPFTGSYEPDDVVAASKSYLTAEMILGNSSKALAANVAVTEWMLRGGRDAEARYSWKGIGAKPQLIAKTAISFPANALEHPGAHNTVLTVDGVASFDIEDWEVRYKRKRHAKYNGNSRFITGGEYLEVEEWVIAATILFDDATGDALQSKAYDAAAATAPADSISKENTYAVSLKNTARSSAPERSVDVSFPAAVLEPVEPEPAGRDLLRARVVAHAFHNGTRMGKVDWKFSNSTGT